MESSIDEVDVKKRGKYTIESETYEIIVNVLKTENTCVSAKFEF